MDEMKLNISSKFMRNIVGKLITKMVKKKLGYRIDVDLNELNIEVINETAHVHANIDLGVNNEEFKKITRVLAKEAES